MSKANKPIAGASAETWKSKYQALLADVEQQQALARKKSSQLIAISKMLGTALPSDDAGLHTALQSLLDAAQETPAPARLPIQLDAFAQKIKALQLERVQHAHAVVDALGQLSEQLQAAAPDAKQRKLLQKFSRRMRKEKSQSANVHERAMALRLGQLQSSQRALLDSLQNGANTGGGIFSRLLGGKPTPGKHSAGDAAQDLPLENMAAAPAAATLSAEPELSTSQAHLPNEQLQADAAQPMPGSLDTVSVPAASKASIVPTESAQAAAATPADAVMSDEVAAILLGLLARIDVPGAMQPRLITLYANLQNGLELGELVDVLDDTSAVVQAALQRDQAEFADFLSSLDQHLDYFNRFASDLSKQLQGIAHNGKQFDSGMVEQLQQLRTAASGSDRQQVQARITDSLDTVARLMHEFSTGQQQYIGELEQRLSELQQHIEALESERVVARQNIAAQRDKLLRDALTGIANREAYELRVDDEYKRWGRYGRPLTLVVADIDLFKSINDSYGHAVGDKVLKIVAKLMSKHLRESDFVARYGGEEFVMLLPETSQHDALRVMENLRSAIVQSPFTFQQQPVKVSCSFGLAEFAGEDTIAAVFEKADRALYQAKAGGRNAVVAATA